MLNVSDYRVSYGQSEIVHGLDFTVQPNEIVAVMGRNGMGKSTLMKALMGVIPESGGTATLDGKQISGMKSHQRVSQGLAYVPQGRMIFSSMTVRENIQTGLTSTGRRAVPRDLYDMFPVLLEMRNRRGGNLSGGQQQQLAIARALASDPKVLLLDEPTEGIQPSIIKEIAQTLKEIRDQRGLTIVVTEQVLSFALDVADRILVVEKGKIVHEEARSSVDAEKVASYLSV
ncbi:MULTISPECIES: urea ABC transporter ATP-binding subunit UrtE [unclassified Marinimicrobium]|jgi:urea transport system ATP-binding protein|uniref:urea ABC transporter ATP-binding subunit UrtE n=1 Tax=Marinimicrobium TaxID=359337 RepID=UPI0004660D01|nr:MULTISPECIES: urea ABC transporter ATP-binding subunit UrtE [unclassified Marinimicrobium]MAN50999.1 urea ABC transporter ATP-binding subunit UrtE [Marinimicrobium sp.]|tara:strand:+ start:957 stop:1646 length:690 start_codon:yes stop_codon:yes gene_type:complete